MLDGIQNTGFLYVGTTVAKIMKEENLCLEEYLENINKILTFFIVGLLYYLENRGRQICEWNTKLILC